MKHRRRKDRALKNGGDPLRDLAHQQEEVRATGHLKSNTGPLDELLRKIDRRASGAADAGIAPFEHRWSAASNRVLRDCGDAESSKRDQLYALLSGRGIAPRGQERDLESSTDRSMMSGVDRAPSTVPLARSIGAGFGERSSRSTIEPCAGAGSAAVPPIATTDLPHAAPCVDQILDDAGRRPRRGFAHQENECRATDPLNTIARQLDDLAHEVNQRENAATAAEIAAFKHRLTALARETEIQAERKLSDGDGSTRRQSGPMSCEIGQYRPSETVQEDANRHGQFELRTRRHGDWGDFGGGRPSFGSPETPAGQCRMEAVEYDLSIILNSIALQRPPQPQDREAEVILCGSGEAESSKRDQLFATVSDRWFTRPNDEFEQAIPADRSTKSDDDRAKPSTLPMHIEGATRKRPSRSTMAPIVRAGLAAVLAMAVVVTGAHFARSRMSEASTAGPITAVLHKNAPTGDAIASGPLTIMPANSVARFQDLVFQLPHLYGIYAINSGRLFELEALPGQAPDPRVAVSAVIPRPSHTTLPDGRVAFLLFRRDVATSISERVPIRVVARIKRPMTGSAVEPRAVGLENAWTIRNVAVDFRVAPVEHNKEMVLLVPESSDFNFPAGRYALILKGQAYDFTIAGPITDSAQCLERVEAANGRFFHECQPPQAGAAEMSSQEPPPLASRSASKLRRQGEKHARANDQPAKAQTSR